MHVGCLEMKDTLIVVSSEQSILELKANLKLLVIPGNNGGTAKFAVHAKGAHLALQSIPQLLSSFQVPDEVGPCVV